MGARKDPDCLCRSCITFPCCRARYEQEKMTGESSYHNHSIAKKIVGDCSYFRSNYEPTLKEIIKRLKEQGKNTDGICLLIENPFIEREFPPRDYLSFH